MRDQPPAIPHTPPPIIPAYAQPASPSPLSPEQILELQNARLAARPIRRAVNVATWDAWSVAIFAGLTLLCGGAFSVSGIILGVGMAVVAAVEFKGMARLRKLDPDAPRTLAMNQLGLAALLIGYAVWSLLSPATANTINDILNQAGVTDQMRGQIADITREIEWTLYGAVIAIAVFVQGGMAWYYHTRAPLLQRYLAATPAWIVQLQQAQVSLG